LNTQNHTRRGQDSPLPSGRVAGEVMLWRAAVARARSALSKTFEGRMEAALASFEVVPENGRGAAGHTLADFAAEVGIGYAAIDQYRQVMKWLGDFVYVYEISSYSLARQAQVSGRWESGADFACFLAEADTPPRLRWTVGALRSYLEEEQRPPARPRGSASGRAQYDRADADAGAGSERPRRPRAVASRAAQKVQSLIAKGVSTTYPEEEDVCWKKAAALIRAHGLTVEVSAGG
jgi:hypothetical protein